VAHHLNLPFYRTGEIKKKPYTDQDVKIVLDLLNEIRPQHIFVAADLSDPNGTHRMCYFVIRDALKEYAKRVQAMGQGPRDASETQLPMVHCYRGAWSEYSVAEASYFVTMSASELYQKILAIHRHESQKDRAMFPGTDPREFWQRARDRNINTANRLSEMGLPKYHAAEAFVKYEGFLPA
jgi:glucosamine-6-phosphate deaminase